MLTSRRRGSTILIVLGLLSILILLATTLAFTSRIEVASSRNFARSVQNRSAAVTGVQEAAFRLVQTLPQDAVGLYDLGEQPVLAPAARRVGLPAPNVVASATNVTVPREIVRPGQTPKVLVGTPSTIADVRFADAAARINLNTADRPTLERLFNYVLPLSGITDRDPSILALAIFNFRLGPNRVPGNPGDDDKSTELNLAATWRRQAGLTPGGIPRIQRSPLAIPRGSIMATGGTPVCSTAGLDISDLVDQLLNGVDESTEYIADIRLPAFGDDRRLSSADDLVLVNPFLFTPEVINALRPHVTGFSISQQAFRTRNNRIRAVLDLNRASVEEIIDALDDIYGGRRDPDLLIQVALNIVDSRDADRIPTVRRNTAGDGWVIGFERTPVITEIYPNAVTPEDRGDDGQYVEIYNPWSGPIDLTGWRLTVGSTDYLLQGILAPQGYLIVTDDYDNANDPNASLDAPGTGSLYDIFGVVANGVTRRVLEIASFNLPHNEGRRTTVRLGDPDGNLIDVFEYEIPFGHSFLNSFQRYNPLVRDPVLLAATPFALPPADPNSNLVAVKLSNLPLDRPFVNVLELFDMFVGFPGDSTSRWAFPKLTLPSADPPPADEQIANYLLMDARLVDIFTIEMQERRPPADIKSDHLTANADGFISRAPNAWNGEFNKAINDEDTLYWVRWGEAPIGLRHGRINLNTAGVAVLSAVGFTDLQASHIVTRQLDGIQAGQLGAARLETLAYRKLSEFLVDEELWGPITDGCDHLARVRPLFDQVAVGSQAFLVEGQSLESPDLQSIRRSGTRIVGLLALDKVRPHAVFWKYVP
jgi:hypothetical protein